MESVKPFVKWAGGKGGLISQLKNFYPFELEDGKIDKYVEPFVGGGAVLINILQQYNVKEAYAFDINRDLINCYNTIKENVEDLIKEKDNSLNNNTKKEQAIRTIRRASDNMTDEDIDKMIDLLSVAFKEAFNEE